MEREDLPALINLDTSKLQKYSSFSDPISYKIGYNNGLLGTASVIKLGT